MSDVMYHYTLFQWMFFFFIYCFFGWCIESTIVSINKRHFVNRGFLRLPMLPLYGSGAVLILWITLPFQKNIIMIYLVGLVGATILEYFTGWAMESLFKIKYWDYSSQKFQFKGRICLSSSLFWGVLSVVLTELIHPPIEKWIFQLNSSIIMISSVLIAFLMLIDTIISAKAALDLAKVLEQLSVAKEDVEHVIEQLEELKNSAQLQIEELKENTQLQISALKENAFKQTQDRIEVLKNRLSELTEKREIEFKKIDFFKSQLIKGHPTSYSAKFNASLKELKERVNQKFQQKGED